MPLLLQPVMNSRRRLKMYTGCSQDNHNSAEGPGSHRHSQLLELQALKQRFQILKGKSKVGQNFKSRRG